MCGIVEVYIIKLVFGIKLVFRARPKEDNYNAKEALHIRISNGGASRQNM